MIMTTALSDHVVVPPLVGATAHKPVLYVEAMEATIGGNRNRKSPTTFRSQVEERERGPPMITCLF
jgi:hypothetical protein